MDTNSKQNTLQINTFTGGMNTDTSDMYLKSDLYRYAENLRVITNEDSNSGELRLIEGNLQLNINGLNGTILSIDSIGDLCVIVVKEGNEWSVYTFDRSQINDHSIDLITKVAGPYDVVIWNKDDFDEDGRLIRKPISTVLRAEHQNNIKLYIADGIHSIIVIQVKGEYTNLNKNIFEVTLLPPPIASNNLTAITGTLKYPVVQYVYRIYSKAGLLSQISALSNKIYMYNGSKGYEPNSGIPSGINVKIPVDTKLSNKLLIFRISYVANQQPVVCDLVYDGDMISDFADSGTSIETKTEEDLLETEYHELIPKYIETKGDYLFGASIKDNTDIVDEQFKDFDTRCYSNGNFIIEDGLEKSFKDWNDNFPSVDYTDIYHEEFSSKDGDKRIHNNTYQKYNANNWITDNIELGTRYNGYGPNLGWKYTYGGVTRSYTDPSVGTSYGTYRRGDVYRFGVILYDKYGNASSVKWIADIKMPTFFENNTNYNILPAIDFNHSLLSSFYRLNNIGIQFIPRNIENWKLYGISAYQIVQCRRTDIDKYVVQQGICGYTLDVKNDNNRIQHPAFLTQCGLKFVAGSSDETRLPDHSMNASVAGVRFDGEYGGVTAETYRRTLLFASPEHCMDNDNNVKLIKNFGNGSLKLELCAHYQTLTGGQYTSDKMPYRPWGQESSMITTPLLGDAPSSSGFWINKPRTSTNYFPSEFELNKNYIFDNAMYDLNLNVPLSRESFTWNDNGPTGFAEKDDCHCFCYINVDLYGLRKYGLIRTAFLLPSANLLLKKYDENGSITDILKEQTILNVELTKDPYFTNLQRAGRGADGLLAFNGNEALTIIGNKAYINWHSPGLFQADSLTINSGLGADNFGYPDGDIIGSYGALSEGVVRCTGRSIYPRAYGNYWAHMSVMFNGKGGRALILETDGKGDVIDLPTDGFPPISISNIINYSATPYGGYDHDHILLSKYIQTGSYATIGENNNIVNCFGGDCFINPFVYYSVHGSGITPDINDKIEWKYRTFELPWNRLCVIYIVPIESEINLRGQISDVFEDKSTKQFHPSIWAQLKSGTWLTFELNMDMYMYNTAYSAQSTLFPKYPNNSEDEPNEYQTRVMHTNNKQNGEDVEQWVQFNSSDLIDVDSRYGAITGLKLFKDKLMFWQEHATGIISSNTRTIIQDSENNSILLGKGDVFERFDYITNLYGTKPQQNTINVTDDSVYWWDGYQKEILKYITGYLVQPLSTLKNVRNFINERDEISFPSVIYDKKYKEVLFNVVGDNDTLVYNEYTQQFTSIYKYSPVFYASLSDIDLTTSSENNIYVNNISNENESTLFGKLVLPKVRFTINDKSAIQKVFDNQEFGGRFYGGGNRDNEGNTVDISDIIFTYDTPLKQHASVSAEKATNIEYDYKMAVPRDGQKPDIEVKYGDRLRGKTMQCEIKSDSNDLDFSLQYVITKYRMSWT